VELYRARGQARARLLNHDGAIKDYTQALALEPADPSTLAWRGGAYLAQSAYQLALHDFEEVIRLNPKNADAYNGRGFAHLAMAAYPLARDDFEQALRLNPENADAYSGRGYARVQLGDYRQAVGDAKAALKRGPKSSQLRYDAARIYAQAVAKVEADPRQSKPQTLAQLYQLRAVMLIRESLGLLPVEQRGPFWRDKIHGDDALSPLRESTSFLRLKREYSKWAK
jgi:tetratricopeptide (TPR) repeat protein